MRILRIGILNLNSLRGEQIIDFTTSPLADHQLYAITGPTGAGKTTILDAITLALYGQTERNKSEKDRKDGSGSVMTYGTGECRAEVEYATATGRYKNVWHRQRAHKRPDRDLTASRREISHWNPQTEAWDILATKKREVDARTEEIVGLDYERFVRSVMLTQGDFARFLKSDPGDKAAILEKITGTEVYKDLSVAAFTRSKLAREEWQRATEALSVAPPLEAETRAGLEQQLKDKTVEVAPLKLQLQQTVQQLGLHDQLEQLQRKAQAATVEQATIAKAWEAFTADRERLKLSASLQPLAPDLVAQQRLKEENRKLAGELAQTEAQLLQHTAAVAAAQEGVATAQTKLNNFYEKLPGREQKFAAVAVLERELTALLRDLASDQKRAKSLDKSLEEKRTESDNKAKEIAAIRKALGGMAPAEVAEQLVSLEVKIGQQAGDIETLLRQIQAQRLQERCRQEEQLRGALETKLKVVSDEFAAAEKAAAAATTELADRRVMHNSLRLSASLSEHKTNLAPGEACPICGATEHPALEGFVPVTDSALERAQREVNQALKQEEQFARALTAAQEQLNIVRRAYDAKAALVTELLAQLPQAVEQLEEDIATLETTLAKLKAEQARMETEQARLRGLRPQLPRLISLETEAAAAQARMQELAEERKAVGEVVAVTEANIAARQQKIKAEIGERTVEQCREMLRRKKEDLVAGLATAEKAEVDVKGQQAVTVAQELQIRERQAVKAKSLEQLEAQLEEKVREHGLSVDAARAALLPEAKMAVLRQRLQELTKQRTTAEALAKKLAQEVSETETMLKEVPGREALEQLRSQQEFGVSEADQLIGALQLQIKQDDARIAEVASQQQAIAGLRREADRWQRLSDLIGSADGKKFRSYAQAITLQQLIAIGNDHLVNINPRYRMEYEAPEPGTPERLEMIIIDQYQNDNRRTMATLSGGESFLISLALALGLSDLASGKQLIQSLFIDEGFGTLDGKTLDQAMTTLEQLQAQGKTIGLISHVPQLQERIHCQLVLERVGDGFSRVAVRG